MIRLYEQVDKTGDKLTYSWILDGFAGSKVGQRAMANKGWKWVRGTRGRGSYITNDQASAEAFALERNLSIESNGTHDVHHAAMAACPQFWSVSK